MLSVAQARTATLPSVRKPHFPECLRRERRREGREGCGVGSRAVARFRPSLPREADFRATRGEQSEILGRTETVEEIPVHLAGIGDSVRYAFTVTSPPSKDDRITLDHCKTDQSVNSTTPSDCVRKTGIVPIMKNSASLPVGDRQRACGSGRFTGGASNRSPSAPPLAASPSSRSTECRESASARAFLAS